MVPLERGGREVAFARAPRIDRGGILRVIRERGAQLWLGERVVRPAQPALAAAEPVIRGDDLPAVQSRARHRRPATARPVREDDPRATPHPHRFFQELVRGGREVEALFGAELLDRPQRLPPDAHALLYARMSATILQCMTRHRDALASEPR